MGKLILKYNLSCGDRISYFHSQWLQHSLKQRTGLMTDCTFVGMDGGAGDKYGNVSVHQAVVMNLCPVLAFTSSDITKQEDPVFMFPDDPVEIISAFVQFLYQGFFIITDTAPAETVLEFMSRLGLVLPPGSFSIAPAPPSSATNRPDFEIAKCIVAQGLTKQEEHQSAVKSEEDERIPAEAGSPILPIQEDQQLDPLEDPTGGVANNDDNIGMMEDKNAVNDQEEINNNADLNLVTESKVKRRRRGRPITSKAKATTMSVYDFDEADQDTSSVPIPITKTTRPRRLRAKSQPLPQTEIVDISSSGVAKPNPKLAPSETSKAKREPRIRMKNVKYFPRDGELDFDTSDLDYSLSVSKSRSGAKKGKPKTEKETDKDSIEEYKEVKKRKPKATHHECMFCDFTCVLAKDLIIHCDLKHPGAVFQCPKCSYQGQCYAKLKVHQYQHKHYADVDLGKKPVIATPLMNSREDAQEAPGTLPSQGTKEERQRVYQGRVRGVKRKLDFGLNAPEEPSSEEANADDLDAVDADVSNIYSTLQEMGEGDQPQDYASSKSQHFQIHEGDDFEDKIAKVAVMKALSGPQLVKNMVRDGPRYKVTCPVVKCKTSFNVVKKDDSVEANTMMIDHQKSVHNFKESQLSYQVDFSRDEDIDPEERDSIDDLLAGNESEEAEEMANNLGRNRLAQYWSDIVRENKALAGVGIVYEEAGQDEEEEISVVCRIGQLRIDGVGDSDLVAREDAAHNMMFLLKEIHNYKDKESIVLNILGEN